MNLLAPAARHGAFNSWDALKLLGLGLMVLDHIGYFFYPEQPWLRALGRGGMPIFLFLVGFAPVQRVRAELVVAAVLVAAANWYTARDLMPLNILFSIMVARFMIHALMRERFVLGQPWVWFAALLVWAVPLSFLWQGGGIVLMMALAGHMYRTNMPDRHAFLIAALFTHGLLQSWEMHFSAPVILVLTLTLAGVGFLLSHFRVKPIALPGAHYAALAARYSLWLYAAHLIAFQLLSGKGY